MNKCMEIISLELDENNAECGICQDTYPISDIYMTACRHPYCMSCFSKLLREEQLRCPLCREDIVTFTFRNRKQHIYTVNRDADTGGREHSVTESSRFATGSGLSSIQMGNPVSQQRMCVEFIIAILTLGHIIWFGVYVSLLERCPSSG